MKFTTIIINQLFELIKKIEHNQHLDLYSRNIDRLHSAIEEEGFKIHDPSGESYTETRTDCEASIVGKSMGKMRIKQVIKPAIYQKEGQGYQLVQRAIVIVEGE
jgi:NAD-dependent SIR2 family protein deacetylase